MVHPAAESSDSARRPDFDRRLMLQFPGSAVTADAGLLADRKLNDALGLTAKAVETLAAARTGKNGRHALVGLLRQTLAFWLPNNPGNCHRSSQFGGHLGNAG